MADTSGTLTAFTAGDLVISISGDTTGGDAYADNAATPLTLEELTTTGTVVGDMVLSQVTTIQNGVTEYAVSSEFGSSSEGSLQLSADGQSLVIMGYGINAATFDAGGAAVYGNTALAQSTSVLGGRYTTVARVVADISYNGTVDSSTALYNVFNTNNPRSVSTDDGTVFYIAGQGVKGDTTQGVFVAHDGANSATAIDNSSDARTVEIYNGELYVSRDSTQVGGGSIETFGTALPTGAATGTILPGIDLSVTVTAANANTINAGMVGQVVDLSPENYFFASPTVLYIADGGIPKEGSVGDGGLQKWVLTDGTWTLEYTLSDGLNLVQNTAPAGTTGLIGLTGTVVGNTVELFATNATINDLDPTFLFGITDTLTGTSGAGETFTTLASGIPGSDNIRGVSFAPSANDVAPTSVTVSSGVTSSGLTVTSGGSLTILNGGTAVGTTVLSGGTELVSAGGVDSGSDIAMGGNETVLGSASGDTIGGVQLVSAATAVVSNELVVNGGSLDLFLKGAIANNTTVQTGGTLNINGAATAYATVLDGGQLNLQSAKASFGGSLTFEGASTIDVTAVTSAGYGGLGVISGWGAGDVIDETSIGAGATFSTTTSGGNTVATITSGSVVKSFIFAGTVVAPTLQLVGDGGTGVEISYLAPPATEIIVSSGVTSTGLAIYNGGSVDVLNGGTLVDATVLSGGSATVESGGTDSGSTISGGGFELVLGTATGDQVYGTQLVSNGGAIVNSETVYAGGAIDLFLKDGITNNVVVSSGGQLNISGNATAYATVLSSGGLIDLKSPKANLDGTLTFAGAGTLEVTAVISAGFGDLAVISGFGSGAVIDVPSIAAGAAFSTVVSGGNTVATITGGSTETFIFAGTSLASGLTLTSDTTGGVEIVAGSSTSSGTTPPSSNTIVVSGGVTSSGLTISSGETIEVLSGGTAVAITLLPGAVETVEAGGFNSGTYISSGGSETVAGSATQDTIAGTQSVTGSVSSETIVSGGSATIAFGGTDTGSVISGGGNELVIGSAGFDQVYGTQVVSGATAVVSNETVFNGGAVDLFLKGGVASGLTVESGGALNISGNATAYDTVISGGLVAFQSPKSVLSGSLTFSGGGTLEVTANTSAGYGDLAVISGFGAGDVIDLSATTSVGAAGSAATLSTTTSGGDTYATVSGGGFTETFIFDGTTIGESLTLGSDGQGGEELTDVACFLPGTHILTAQGEVAVENLVVGDVLVTASGRRRPLCWIGQGRALATRGRRGAATPLIVRKGALADNVPHRDLRITKGHSLYLDDVLIPVEFLVNHRTILWDDHAQEVTVYHLELDAHDVLVANGAPAESYRDDGNRWLFRNANSGWNQPPKPACAPVLTGGPIVDAVWARLRDRSGPLGRLPLTDEPDLHLTADGRRVDATHRRGDVYVFGLANRPESVRIVSRSAVPQELGFARDSRGLGVALRQIMVCEGTGLRIAEATDARLADGFHPLEPDADFVWTDGDAAMPMDMLAAVTGPVEIVLTIAGTTRYIDDGEVLRVA